MTHAQRLAVVKQFIREPYAWPGGYPVYLVTRDGGALSHDACKDCWREIVSSVMTRHFDSGWYPEAIDINWEDSDLYCDHTGKRIESAYAEPENEER